MKLKKIKRGQSKNFIMSSGFTLIEVMIAVAIFGFLMLYVSQFMRQETKMLNQATEQNEMMQKARVAMVQVIDETRIPPAGSSYSSASSLPLRYDAATHELWLERDGESPVLIANDIYEFNLSDESAHLIKIEIVAGDPNTSEFYRLVSWARIY